METYVAVNGTQLFVERRGHGEPLLLIPGLGAGNWLWQHNIERLSKHFHLIMPELRGSDRSDKPDQHYSIALFAQDLHALLDTFHLPQANVIGASMGGFVAQYLASQWPNRVKKLVLVSTSLGGQCQIGPAGEILSRIIRPHGRTRNERFNDAYKLNFTEAYLANHPGELERITTWRNQFPQPEYAYYRQLLAGNAYHGARRAATISAPTLICHGEDDEVVPIANGQMLREAIPNAGLKIFSGKHLFFFEQFRKFNQAVVEFFSDNESTAPKIDREDRGLLFNREIEYDDIS